MKKISPFTEECICRWSKNDEFGFIPNSECPVHGDGIKESLNDGYGYDNESPAKEGKEVFGRLRSRN